jgi:hypothetical protein
MEADQEMAEMLKQDFPVLNETNKKGVIAMTKFLILIQNSIVPDFLKENEPADMSIHQQEEKRAIARFGCNG